MQNSKKISVIGLVIVFVLSLCVTGLVSAQIGPFSNKGEVLGSKNITVFDLDENGLRISGTEKLVVKYAYKSNSRIVDESNEIVSRRTKHSRTFSLGEQNGREIYKTEIISGEPQYYKDRGGKWWQVEYATTTPEGFVKRGVSLGDKVAALLGVEKVWATTSTSSPVAGSNSPVDGAARHSSGSSSSGYSWSTLKTQSGNETDSDSSTTLSTSWTGSSTNNEWNTITEAIMLFDTSSIPDADNIDSATLSTYGSDKADPASNNPTFNVYSANPASNSAIVGSDYDNNGSTAFSSDIGYSSLSVSGYNDWALNASGIANIDVTGVSKFSHRESTYVVGGSTPTWATWVGSHHYTCYSADETGIDKDPLLTVIHSIPAPVISDVQSTNITNNSSVVTWATDVTSDSKVVYGTTNPVESSSPLLDSYNSNLVTSHDIALTELDSNTTYYYKTVSTKEGVTATSSQSSFITLQAPVLYAYKSQDQATTSQTTLFTDDDLSITLATSTTYIITAAITASSTATQPDINTSFNSPPDSSMALTFGSFDGSAKVAGSGLFSSDASEVDIDLPSTGLVVIHINGAITTGSTAGTLEFEWAQNTSSATAIKLFKGSYLRAEKID